MSGKRGSFIQPSFSFAIESYIFVCNWFYTWPLSKISFLSPLITCSKLTFRGCSDRWLQTRSIFSHLNYVQSTFWQLGNDSKWFQTIFFFEQILWNISFKLFPFFPYLIIMTMMINPTSVASPSTQWAAVKTHSLEMRLPPQKYYGRGLKMGFWSWCPQ